VSHHPRYTSSRQSSRLNFAKLVFSRASRSRICGDCSGRPCSHSGVAVIVVDSPKSTPSSAVAGESCLARCSHCLNRSTKARIRSAVDCRYSRPSLRMRSRTTGSEPKPPVRNTPPAFKAMR
jgi:hypothetical protein